MASAWAEALAKANKDQGVHSKEAQIELAEAAAAEAEPEPKPKASSSKKS